VSIELPLPDTSCHHIIVDGLVRVAPAFAGKPILTAEQIEDVIAYLVTLRDASTP
jgi:mono/diheme cytochrome c family protein